MGTQFNVIILLTAYQLEHNMAVRGRPQGGAVHDKGHSRERKGYYRDGWQVSSLSVQYGDLFQVTNVFIVEFHSTSALVAPRLKYWQAIPSTKVTGNTRVEECYQKVQAVHIFLAENQHRVSQNRILTRDIQKEKKILKEKNMKNWTGVFGVKHIKQ